LSHSTPPPPPNKESADQKRWVRLWVPAGFQWFFSEFENELDTSDGPTAMREAIGAAIRRIFPTPPTSATATIPAWSQDVRHVLTAIMRQAREAGDRLEEIESTLYVMVQVTVMLFEKWRAQLDAQEIQEVLAAIQHARDAHKSGDVV